MNLKNIILATALLGSLNFNAQAVCVLCPIKKKIIIHNLVSRISDKIEMIQTIKPSTVTLTLKLPGRKLDYFAIYPKNTQINYIKNFHENSMNIIIKYGLDNLLIELRNGINLRINDKDFSGKIHNIDTQLRQPVRNLIGKVKVTMDKGTINIVMPRF